MDELPLIVEVVAYGETEMGEGNPVAYVKGLMPFLNELAEEVSSSAP
jgi:hypothetical protein